jgi:hypothetical protein
MAELKAGGLAMVIGGSPDLYGFVLKTEKLVMPGEQFTGPDGIVSRNDIIRAKWLCTDERITVRLKDGTETDGWGLFWINHLMPIDGNAEKSEEHRQKELAI